MVFRDWHWAEQAGTVFITIPRFKLYGSDVFTWDCWHDDLPGLFDWEDYDVNALCSYLYSQIQTDKSLRRKSDVVIQLIIKAKISTVWDWHISLHDCCDINMKKKNFGAV